MRHDPLFRAPFDGRGEIFPKKLMTAHPTKSNITKTLRIMLRQLYLSPVSHK
jgi:hypothetical protein